MRLPSLFGALAIASASLGLPASSSALAPAPVLSNFTATPAKWDPTVGRLQVQTASDSAGLWHFELRDICTDKVVRQLDGMLDPANPTRFTLDGTVAPQIGSGAYQLSMTPSALGGAAGTPLYSQVVVAKARTSPADSVAVCDNVMRYRQAESTEGAIEAAIALAQQIPDATPVLLASVKATADYLAVASVVATQRGWPLLLTDASELNYALKSELKRRGVTKVVLLGNQTAISSSVATAIRKFTVVTRKKAATADALVAGLYAVPATAQPAVVADFSGDRKLLLLATAFANANHRLLLNARGDLASTMDKYLAAGGVAVVSANVASDATLLKLDLIRVSADSLAVTSAALARATTADVELLQLRAASSRVSASDFAAVAVPQRLLALDSATADFATKAWLNARSDISKISIVERVPKLPDAVAATIGRLLLQRGEPTDVIGLDWKPLGPLSAPATFAFSGSGWGHGIGMSQWGAYQAANEGLTAEEILTHYYSGTAVDYAPADADIFVSLQNRITSGRFRVLPIDGSTPAWSIETSRAGKSVQIVSLTSDQTLSVMHAEGLLKLKVSGGAEVSLKAADTVKLKWSGTRFADALGDAPALLQFAGPGESLGRDGSGREYRYGLMKLVAAPASSDQPAGLQVINRVRLADEYIYGIAEVSSSWPAEALRAQVIAARSYAYYDVYNKDGSVAKTRSACGCQVYDDTRDQNYVGYSKLADGYGDAWKTAVDSTVQEDLTALVVYAGSEVAQTFFFAGSGGATQNKTDVWGGDPISYLQTVDDPYTLNAAAADGVTRWSPRVRSQKVVAAAFGLPAVATLDFSDRFASGAVRTVTATAPDGKTATISGERFRSRVTSDSGSSLNSTWVWRTLIDFTAVPSDTTTQWPQDVWAGYLKLPVATSTTAVIATGMPDGDFAIESAAAAFAGAQGFTFLTADASGDANRLRDYLTSRGFKRAVVVGDVDPQIASLLKAAKLQVDQVNGSDPQQVSGELNLLAQGWQGAVMVAADAQEHALALAANMAARTRRQLLLVNDVEALAIWLALHPPTDAVAVGDAVDDALLAGLANPRRLALGDLAVAALVAAQQASGVVRGIAVSDPEADPEPALLAAAYALPLFYPDASTMSTLEDWLRRQSLAASVVDLGADAQLVNDLRRA